MRTLGDALAVDVLECCACHSGRLEARTRADSAQLLCSGCGAVFEVKNGIPRFVAADGYAQSFGFQWNTHRRAQLDSCSGVPISSNRLFGTTGWPRSLAGERVLEAGSGAGRFTEVMVGTGAEVFSLDYSSAVDANAQNNGAARNLTLFQADILNLPLRPRSFDRVLCIGVLQHTPDPARAFASLAEKVKPGGQLVVDVYRRQMTSMISWKYLLRPFTKRMLQQQLYGLLKKVVPPLVPFTAMLRRVGGAGAARLSPILEYSHLGLHGEANREWALLDTFDMYSPAYDLPQSARTLRAWFEKAGFEELDVGYGPHGLVGRGRRPAR